MKRICFLIHIALVTLIGGSVFSGCLIVPTQPEYGDIQFSWSFEGETSCRVARVDEIDIEIYNSSDEKVFEDTVTCEGGDITVTQFSLDDYTIYLDAYNDRNEHLFEGTKSVTVDNEETVDAGVITLVRPGSAELGDIAFSWSFDGTESCNAAGVDELDIAIYDFEDDQVYLNTLECYGTGVTILDFEPGTYSVYLDGYGSEGTHLFSGQLSVYVEADSISDMGTIDLEPVVNTQLGDLEFFWAFLYPVNNPETSCLIAGVDEVDIELTPIGMNTPVYEATMPCNAQNAGIRIEDLAAGNYQLRVWGYADNDELGLLLYESDNQFVEVVSDQVTDLGDLHLSRYESHFSDIGIFWDLDCSILDIDEVELTITRLLGENSFVDDSFTRECSASSVLRSTFVPGSYRIDAAAVGSGNSNYVGTITIDATSGEQSDAHLQIVLDD